MSLADRTAWIQALMGEPGLADWFNNILGVMHGYADLGMGSSPGWGNSWLGLVNAGILHSIHDGYLLSKQGRASFAGAAGGASNWARFFSARAQGVSAPDLISLWGMAEQAGTEYGIWMAGSRGVYPNLQERGFLALGDRYRSGMLDDDAAQVGNILGGGIGGSVCGRLCAEMGGAFGSAAGSLVVNQAQDPRSTQAGDDHIMRPVTRFLLRPLPALLVPSFDPVVK